MKRPSLHSQRGLTMLMVMMLMTAMLLGALSFAKLTEIGTLVTNNVVSKDASYHAAEVGRATAFAQLQALVNKNAGSGSWYYPTTQATNATTGIPSLINFNSAGAVAGNVGRFQVNYVVERLCTVTNVRDSATECVVLQKPPGVGDLEDMSYPPKERLHMHPRQYRITVRVSDPPRGTQTFTQTLVTAAN